jgi:hypothetical protein
MEISTAKTKALSVQGKSPVRAKFVLNYKQLNKSVYLHVYIIIYILNILMILI